MWVLTSSIFPPATPLSFISFGEPVINVFYSKSVTVIYIYKSKHILVGKIARINTQLNKMKLLQHKKNVFDGDTHYGHTGIFYMKVRSMHVDCFVFACIEWRWVIFFLRCVLFCSHLLFVFCRNGRCVALNTKQLNLLPILNFFPCLLLLLLMLFFIPKTVIYDTW